MYEGTSAKDARFWFTNYKRLSRRRIGNFDKRAVELWRDDEPIEEYEP